MKLMFGAAIAAITVLTASTTAFAQAAPPPACKALNAEVMTLRKELSDQKWTSYAQSAPQATQLATEMANTLAMMKMNLDLMSAHRCPMPTEPISTTTYMAAALQCSTATIRKEEDKDVKCDRATWLVTFPKSPPNSSAQAK